MHKRHSLELQLTLLSLFASVPLCLLMLWVMILGKLSTPLILLAAFVSFIVVAYVSHQIYQRISDQFKVLGNLLDGMTVGDFSLRARASNAHGELGYVYESLNALSKKLSEHRWASVESQLLLQVVIDHIDVAIVALSNEHNISFLNPAAKKLLQLEKNDSSTQLLQKLSFVKDLKSGHAQLVELTLGHQQGRFNVHIEEFRESGEQKKLLFITDVRTLLRSEERKAWQSLVRVISHEINNSLSPIASISQTLLKVSEKTAIDAKVKKDLISGLNIISGRAVGLGKFVESYKQLAKLPEPEKHAVSVKALLHKVTKLFQSPKIIVDTVNDIDIFIDPVQFEQVLINLLKNASEAMTAVGEDKSIRLSWHLSEPYFHLKVIDEGCGIQNRDNLFVPFYSTKKQGSGVGLVLCRQIIEGHGGRLSIKNRDDGPGCCAHIELPFSRFN
ncbi:MAG: two-component system nitrogen regulation sensor histidine kinase NtrY [Flavobacteriales bacterium]|jgi:two-component system nitrogen regulation sensor histidine kinase NtrY